MKGKQLQVTIVTAAVVLALIVGLGLFKYTQIAKAIENSKHFAPPPEAVTSVVAAESVWQRELSAVGSLASTQGVTLSAEESGKVSKINFESGQKVEQGTVLVELDTAVEDANLRGVSALAEDARVALKRAESLRAKSANSEADLDTARAHARETEAAAESLKATIARKRVIAPFSGRAGIRMVNVGQFVSPGTAIVPLYSLDPLYLNFSLPEQLVRKISVGNKVRLSVDGMESSSIEGTVNAIDPNVDLVTRNVNVQATVRNEQELMRPGMFAKVAVVLPESDKVIAIPTSSINYAPYGDTVYVIEHKKGEGDKETRSVRQQVVKLGDKRGDQVAVISGLKPGDEVVSSGTFKLRPGAQVVINNTLAPANNPNPQPADT